MGIFQSSYRYSRANDRCCNRHYCRHRNHILFYCFRLFCFSYCYCLSAPTQFHSAYGCMCGHFRHPPWVSGPRLLERRVLCAEPLLWIAFGALEAARVLAKVAAASIPHTLPQVSVAGYRDLPFALLRRHTV